MFDLHRGDCLDILPRLAAGSVDAVVSDPPYGVRHLNGHKLRSNYTRFSGGRQGKTRAGAVDYPEVSADDEPFDPSPWLAFRKVVLWGSNCYSDKLPPGSSLVWCKKPANSLGKFLGDCELAWVKGGHGVYLFHHVWDGFNKESERGVKRAHPTQKPVAVMAWCIERLKLKPGATILDPYMGSGSTGVAAVGLGFNFIGIERDPAHFATARRRIRAAEKAAMRAAA